MNIPALITLTHLILAAASVRAERAYRITSDSPVGTHIHVIEFPKEENFGFELIEANPGLGGATVTAHTEPDTVFVINGGYFDINKQPVGFCRIDNRILSSKVADHLSGFVTINASGSLDLVFGELLNGNFPSVLQAGPFVVDPGGTHGIRQKNGPEARRTLIGLTRDGRVLVISTTKINLHRLGEILIENIPNIDRVLNLDGGPSAGLVYGDIALPNQVPVVNFLRKRKVNR